jgi:hypothetical protein
MPNMIESKVMHDHSCPVTLGKLVRNMASHIVVNFRKVLIQLQFSLLYYSAKT